jgi:hypothetical protein
LTHASNISLSRSINVESCPDVCKVRRKYKVVNEGWDGFDDRDEFYKIEGCPLHFACMTEAVSLQVVEYLVEQFPDAVKAENFRYRQLPLHFACVNEVASLEVVQYLVEQWPGSVRASIADGSIPMHLACSNKAPSLEVVQYLVERWPDSI